MDHTDTAICALELTDKAAPEWVQLMPLGLVPSRDGRPAWRLDNPDQVIAAMRELRMELPIDYEHQTDLAPENGLPAPAAGWMTDFQARPEGLFAKVRWTDRARAMLEAGEYRFLSPVFRFDKQSREVRLILRAGLTNNPALYLQALARATTTEEDSAVMDELLKKLRQLLQLDATADEQAICTAVESVATAAGAAKAEAETALASVAAALGLDAKVDPKAIATAAAEAAAKSKATAPDPAAYVPMDQHQALATRLNALEEGRAEEKASAAVEDAVKAGKVTPANREWAQTYARKDPEGFAAFAAKAPVVVKPGGQVPTTSPKSTDGPLDEDELAVCRAMGLTEEEYRKVRNNEEVA